MLCNKKSVIKLQQGSLCRECFKRYFQKKVYRTIRKYELISKDDRLCVACNVCEKSFALLYLVNKLAKRRRQPIFALGIEEGNENKKDGFIRNLVRFCEKEKIDCVILSLNDEYDTGTKSITDFISKNKLSVKRSEILELLKRKLIDSYALKLKATRVILADSLDFIAESTLFKLFSDYGILSLIELGPVYDRKDYYSESKHVPVSRPLFFATDSEIYEYQKSMKNIQAPGRNRKKNKKNGDKYRQHIAGKLTEIDNEFIGTKSGIIQNLVKIIPALKDEYGKGNVTVCKKCKTITQTKPCLSCLIDSELRKTWKK